MGDQSPIVESWEGDIFAKHLHFQQRVVGDVHFSEFDEPAEALCNSRPFWAIRSHWVHYMSTRIRFAYPAYVAYHLPLLPAPTLCIQRASRASLNRQSSHFELSGQHYNTNAFTSCQSHNTILKWRISGGEDLALWDAECLYGKPFLFRCAYGCNARGTDALADINQGLAHTSSCSVNEDYVILLNMCELDTELSSSLDSRLGGNSTNTSPYV